METVQAIILQLRALGLSQTAIARKIGAPQGRISRWERGDAPSAVDDALRLSGLLARVRAEGDTQTTEAA